MTQHLRFAIGGLLILAGICWFVVSLPDVVFFEPAMLAIVGVVTIFGSARLARINDEARRHPQTRSRRMSRIALAFFAAAVLLLIAAFVVRDEFRWLFATALLFASIGSAIQLVRKTRNAINWMRTARDHRDEK